MVAIGTVSRDRALRAIFLKLFFTTGSRYYNNTRMPVTDLILSDSLAARLEYVVGSAAADRPSNVTLADNEVGSQIIRFEIPGPIPPAASGLVVFKVKVR